MEATNATPSAAAKQNTHVFLDELQVGQEAQVTVMICRNWDTHTSYGRFISTDYIASDQKGNVIQMTARSNVAHHFIPRLTEGNVYLLDHFDVIPNRPEYRVLNENRVIIQLQGATFLKRQATADTSAFIRHPFTCIEFQDLQPTDGKYLIDVVGYVTNVGSPEPTRTGTTTMEFDLVNERGRAIRTTLWGILGQGFSEKMPSNKPLYCVILSSVTVKKGLTGGLTFSSSSATMILDDPEIPALRAFIEKMSGVTHPIVVEETSPGWQLPPPKEGTLGELLAMVRKGKKNTTGDVFKCKVTLTNIRARSGWYYPTCSICKAKKGITRQRSQHWCESCNDAVPEPIIRFRIICDVKDGSAETVVVFFDETAEQLTNTTAPVLLAESDADHCNRVLPNPIANLLNTTQMILLKIGSHYEHGPYESFNCIKVYPEENRLVAPPPVDVEQQNEPLGATEVSDTKCASSSAPKGPKRNLEVPTPAKDLERASRRRFIVASDSEDDEADAAE